jgi:hypothetical protein
MHLPARNPHHPTTACLIPGTGKSKAKIRLPGQDKYDHGHLMSRLRHSHKTGNCRVPETEVSFPGLTQGKGKKGGRDEGGRANNTKTGNGSKRAF